jgi:uncharacterized membrane protein YgdD (TMEM256/DUF423 family)
MDRLLFPLGALMAAIAVAAGAFGAHGLRGRLSPEMLAIFETGARYQMYHALGMLIAARAGSAGAGWLFLAGIVLFSGSLYALGLSDVRWLGAITPLGGVCFIAGWLVLAWSSLRT